MRIGVNGTLPVVGQAYSTLNTTITGASYSATSGELLSSVGTVIGLESGPAVDQFFLQFDLLGTATDAIVEQSPCPNGVCPSQLVLQPPSADFGVRLFAQTNSTFSQLTGIPTSNASVVTTYQSVQQQLPETSTLEAYSSADQVGVAQLAVQYCNQAVTTTALTLPGVTVPLSGTTYSSSTGTNQVANALAAMTAGTAALPSGTTLSSQPAASTVATELENLIGALCTSTPCSGNASRVQAVTVAACAAALGNADVMID
jgi:hypothetical protein